MIFMLRTLLLVQPSEPWISYSKHDRSTHQKPTMIIIHSHFKILRAKRVIFLMQYFIIGRFQEHSKKTCLRNNHRALGVNFDWDTHQDEKAGAPFSKLIPVIISQLTVENQLRYTLYFLYVGSSLWFFNFLVINTHAHCIKTRYIQYQKSYFILPQCVLCTQKWY